ncbi:ATP-dependent RNA helicase HrpA [Magnetococcales bacterium HHB-1]
MTIPMMPKKQLATLSRALRHSLKKDQPHFKRRLALARKRLATGHPIDRILKDLQEKIQTSQQIRTARLENLPKLHYPDLPICEKRIKILKTIKKHQVVVLCGATGSGKTTQLPKLCLELERGIDGWIGMTQPRRLAARNVARFLAKDLNTELGDKVGFKVRFSEKLSSKSHVKIMTDGILLAETQNDRYLWNYDTLIIDEAHERSLNIDFILGYLKTILQKRPDLKLIISSATLDTEKFSKHFDNAPIIEVSGRTYPVEILYRPWREDDSDMEVEEQELPEQIAHAIDELPTQKEPPFDILVFLPGEREINETRQVLEQRHLKSTEVLPLFARLSNVEQDRIFKTSSSRRRIILATNVAETSITVPGIRYVIDSGLARISRYSNRTQVQRLPVERIAQASADQRAGRCGRLAAGICIRLYSLEDFQQRPIYTDPEILRTTLASVILQMKALRLGDIETFPFVDAPPKKSIREGLRLLRELGALDERDQLTALGKDLSRLPLDPKAGRILLAAQHLHALNEAIIIVSALQIRDPRLYPEDNPNPARQQHQLLQEKRSDFITWINLWEFIQKLRRDTASNNQFKKALKKNYISWIRYREWYENINQLKERLGEMGHTLNKKPATYDAIHRALLTGLLTIIGFKEEKHTYRGIKQLQFHIFPGSGLFKSAPKWIMAAEMVETSRLYARTCGRIQPEWIEEAAGSLCTRSWSDPRWDEKGEKVIAKEQVSLFGLILLSNRTVHYGPIHTEESRIIFIREALIANRWHLEAPFIKHNSRLITEIREIENRTRRGNLMVDEEVLFDFFDQIPRFIHNRQTFEKWYRKAQRKDKNLLFMEKKFLLRQALTESLEDLFPGSITIRGIDYPLEYQFNPGHGADGISISIPLPTLQQTPPEPFEWLIPGLCEEKTVALFKSLPKTYRRRLVPLPHTAKKILDQCVNRQESMITTLTACIEKNFNLVIPLEQWQPENLPEHLSFRFRIIDQNKIVAQGRDLTALKTQFGQRAEKEFHQVAEQSTFKPRTSMRWDFADLPERIVLEASETSQSKTYGFPTLHDLKDSVKLDLSASINIAEEKSLFGLRRLFLLALSEKVRQLKKQQHYNPQMLFAIRPYTKQYDLEQITLLLSVDEAFFMGRIQPIYQEKIFKEHLQKGRNHFPAAFKRTQQLIQRIIEALIELQKRLQPLKRQRPQLYQTVIVHFKQLIFEDFLMITPLPWLKHYPRYLKGIQIRLERSHTPMKDKQKEMLLKPWYDRYHQQCKQSKVDNPALKAFRWTLEEYRVSLFAQELRTAFPISEKRLNKQWQEVLHHPVAKRSMINA